MELIAHRGCGAVAPENTVAAVRRAARQLPAVEVDVRRCGSGELVCIHDGTVDRVTGHRGPVAEHTLSELREMDVQGSGEPIPTLAEVVAAVPEGITLQVELKTPGLGADVLAQVAAHDPVRLTSFEPAALRAVRDGEFPTGYLFRGEVDDALAIASELGCANVHPHWQTCRDTSAVARARDRGFGVYAWGIETDPAALTAVRAAGVDGATVDRPDLDDR